ncbi:MAG TPA: GNAT family N-acetyltransferase [Clostridia bacterium]|nr:GNAT family N-acetyltransferase [Clostridia bacterium]
MVYYDDGEILIRGMKRADAEAILAAELAQGYHETMEKYETRLRDQAEGRSAALVAIYAGNVAGYVNVYFDAPWGAFAGTGYCEIVDFGVLEKYRRRGVGGRLMDAAEAIAFTKADTVYLGVGLHSGYGSAQRMYVKRGYVPDGSGAWYGDRVCEPYVSCRNDDDLVLYLSKTRGNGR